MDVVTKVEATRKAVEVEGEYFGLLLDFYLKSKYGMGLELVAHDRRKFQRALADLIGRDSAKLMCARIDSEIRKRKRLLQAPHQQG